MSYVVTDKELNKLYAVKNQLGFMSALLSTARRVECSAQDVDGALGALHSSIEDVIDTLENRHDASQEAPSMGPHDWVNVVNLVSGREPLTVEHIVKLDNRLAAVAVLDPDMHVVFKAWRAVLTDDGRNAMMTTANDMGGFYVRFERPAPPSQPTKPAPTKPRKRKTVSS